HVSKVQDLSTILPEGDMSRFFAGTFVERVDAKPLPFGNVFAGLAVGVLRVRVVQIEIHCAVRAVTNVQGKEGIADNSTLRLPLEYVPPGWLAIGNVALRKVKPYAVIKFGIFFRLEPAKQPGPARRKVPRALGIDKELSCMKAAVSEADLVHARPGEPAVEDASAARWATWDSGDTPLREIPRLHVSRPNYRAGVRGSRRCGGRF